PDPGPPVRLTAARTSVSWPDLERPATDPPRTAAPSTAPTGPAPAGGASTAPAPKPPSSAPAHDPLVPSSHRGTGVPASPSGTGRSPRADEAEEVVVLRGDSLWTIAARHLGPTATPEQISVEWHRWWAANSDVIGHDPNVILPGQRLIPPSGP
ncbi:LysM peptidoglycan-binding domain-containing protein, partial [Frankia tisae]|uniref:LysM peptidoglycan-binding domain-containing protein n=1 Tax=Frankia tisae TaxID=2950104 RepID=UPI0021C12A82